MSRKSKNTYKYFKSIDFLPIFNFFKVMETGDKRFLLKIEDYESLPEIEDITFLNKVWDEIELQYGKAEDNNRSVIQFVTAKGVHKLELEYLVLWDLHNLMIIDEIGNNAIECLEKAGYKGKDIKWIEKRIKVLTNKIKLKRKDISDNNPEGNNSDWTLIIDKIEDIKGRNIDVHKITVRQYISIIKNIKTKKTNGKG